MIENAVTFFEQYKNDESLRERVRAAVDAYPGSLEIREALVEHALLPIARELGLDFSVGELRAYETRVKMSRLNQSDEEYFASAQKALDKAITLAPNNIGYLFDEITSLLDYEGESPDMAATALLNLIDRNYSEHPHWNLYGEPFTQQDFTDAVKEYCYSFWKLATPVGYDSFYNVSRRMMKAEPKDVGFIDNVGAYWQVAKKDNKMAAKFYKKALKLDPNDYAANQNMKFITNNNKK